VLLKQDRKFLGNPLAAFSYLPYAMNRSQNSRTRKVREGDVGYKPKDRLSEGKLPSLQNLLGAIRWLTEDDLEFVLIRWIVILGSHPNGGSSNRRRQIVFRVRWLADYEDRFKHMIETDQASRFVFCSAQRTNYVYRFWHRMITQVQ